MLHYPFHSSVFFHHSHASYVPVLTFEFRHRNAVSISWYYFLFFDSDIVLKCSFPSSIFSSLICLLCLTPHVTVDFYIWIQTLQCCVIFLLCFLHLDSDTSIQCSFLVSVFFYIWIQTLLCSISFVDPFFTFGFRHCNAVSVSCSVFLHLGSWFYFLHFNSNVPSQCPFLSSLLVDIHVQPLLPKPCRHHPLHDFMEVVHGLEGIMLVAML